MWNRDAKGHNLTAACSHHEDFRRHLDLLPADVFVACLDIGHAEMGGLQTSAVQMIETLSSRLQAIHLHDNDLYEDTHELPYCSRINFGKIIEALKKVGYQGDITMEADRYIRKFPLELYPAGARFMASIADDFRKKVQK
jgi:sugar phosphate isomerase/epimerase